MITGAEWFNDERFRLFTSAPYQRHLFSLFFCGEDSAVLYIRRQRGINNNNAMQREGVVNKRPVH